MNLENVLGDVLEKFKADDVYERKGKKQEHVLSDETFCLTVDEI